MRPTTADNSFLDLRIQAQFNIVQHASMAQNLTQVTGKNWRADYEEWESINPDDVPNKGIRYWLYAQGLEGRNVVLAEQLNLVFGKFQWPAEDHERAIYEYDGAKGLACIRGPKPEDPTYGMIHIPSIAMFQCIKQYPETYQEIRNIITLGPDVVHEEALMSQGRQRELVRDQIPVEPLRAYVAEID